MFTITIEFLLNKLFKEAIYNHDKTKLINQIMQYTTKGVMHRDP